MRHRFAVIDGRISAGRGSRTADEHAATRRRLVVVVDSIVTVMVGKSFGDTPDHSVTVSSLELNEPIGTSVSAAFFNHAW